MEHPQRKRRRPAVACTECRRRKVKCDRTRPCGPCNQSSLRCVYRSPSSSSPPPDQNAGQTNLHRSLQVPSAAAFNIGPSQPGYNTVAPMSTWISSSQIVGNSERTQSRLEESVQKATSNPTHHSTPSLLANSSQRIPARHTVSSAGSLSGSRSSTNVDSSSVFLKTKSIGLGHWKSILERVSGLPASRRND